MEICSRGCAGWILAIMVFGCVLLLVWNFVAPKKSKTMKTWETGHYCICKDESSKKKCKMVPGMKMFATIKEFDKREDIQNLAGFIEPEWSKTGNVVAIKWEEDEDCDLYYILLYDRRKRRVCPYEMVTLSTEKCHKISNCRHDIGAVKVLRLFRQKPEDEYHGLIEIFESRGLYEKLIIADQCCVNKKRFDEGKSKHKVHFGFLQRKESGLHPTRVALKRFVTNSVYERELIRDLLDRVLEAGGKYTMKYLASTDTTKGEVWIVMEIHGGYTLADLMKDEEGTLYKNMESQIKTCFAHIMLGLIHLHDIKMWHGEMISKNIMLSIDRKCFKIGNYVKTAMSEDTDPDARYKRDLECTANIFSDCLKSFCKVKSPNMKDANNVLKDWLGPGNETQDVDSDANLGKYLVWFMNIEKNLTAHDVLQHPYFWDVHTLIYFVNRMDACFYVHGNNNTGECMTAIKTKFNEYFPRLDWYSKFVEKLKRYKSPHKTVKECSVILKYIGQLKEKATEFRSTIATDERTVSDRVVDMKGVVENSKPDLSFVQKSTKLVDDIIAKLKTTENEFYTKTQGESESTESLGAYVERAKGVASNECRDLISAIKKEQNSKNSKTIDVEQLKTRIGKSTTAMKEHVTNVDSALEKARNTTEANITEIEGFIDDQEEVGTVRVTIEEAKKIITAQFKKIGEAIKITENTMANEEIIDTGNNIERMKDSMIKINKNINDEFAKLQHAIRETMKTISDAIDKNKKIKTLIVKAKDVIESEVANLKVAISEKIEEAKSRLTIESNDVENNYASEEAFWKDLIDFINEQMRSAKEMLEKATYNGQAIDEITKYYYSDKEQQIFKSDKLDKSKMSSFLRCIRNTHAHYHDNKNRYFKSTSDVWQFFAEMYPKMISFLHREVWTKRSDDNLPDDIKKFFLTPPSVASLDLESTDQ